jgi:hypothetical protein
MKRLYNLISSEAGISKMFLASGPKMVDNVLKHLHPALDDFVFQFPIIIATQM